jgi:hypothetical protein
MAFFTNPSGNQPVILGRDGRPSEWKKDTDKKDGRAETCWKAPQGKIKNQAEKVEKKFQILFLDFRHWECIFPVMEMEQRNEVGLGGTKL